ncbi:MAG: cysteine--tRNA ligase, partial [Spirochaetes bacterium]
PRATEHIEEIVEFVKVLMEKGFAYRSEDGIYFSIRKFPDYGKLSGINVKNLKAGARVKQDEYDKEHAHDFALWKFWDEEDGDVYWETDIGKGRPGWHIECSVMSTKYLGETFDIHTGGVDLIFPHHENEIAQSEAKTGKPFVRYWLHNEHLLVEGRKMSKSLGNFFTLRDLLAKGYEPMAIRYLLLSAHYRAKLNFTEKALKSAENTVKSLKRFVQDILDYRHEGNNNPEVDRIIEKARRGFETSLDDDLNMPEALPFVFEMISEINTFLSRKEMSTEDAKRVYRLMLRFDSVLGLGLDKISKTHAEKIVDIDGEKYTISYHDVKPDKEIEKLVIEREKYRRMKAWKEADEIRDRLRKKGIILEDVKGGVKVTGA